MMKLYELAGQQDNNLFSPYCWRIRMALAHKGLDASYIPCRFTEKELIRESGQKLVPVLQDGEKIMHDSWGIARYLEETYPENPLFPGKSAVAQTLFFRHWVEGTLQPLILPVIIMDIFNHIHEKDRDYFRITREKRFGMPLEQREDKSPEQIERLATALSPVRAVFADNDFLCGTQPGFADYILFGAFQWARGVSETKLLDQSDPVFQWRDRLLQLFDGMPLKTAGYPV
ncbi:glutathione S-transferase N-terminal domain-containing protein [Aestuariispira insulae]|uniref:Glutathione S-transferase n=1 Tax=Aestuariispira insulae TaxID=1461337 RepID=A0A3D9HVX9_9PROT|nr:glutathione S-transferase N-terminal domain-containing protein [Aestuariispira insulae]RED53541.1 glutathione S-transferase [Aestuariispira insulae]